MWYYFNESSNHRQPTSRQKSQWKYMPHELIKSICTSTVTKEYETTIIFFCLHLLLSVIHKHFIVHSESTRVKKKTRMNSTTFRAHVNIRLHILESHYNCEKQIFRIGKKAKFQHFSLGSRFLKEANKKKSRNGWKCLKWFKLKTECESRHTRIFFIHSLVELFFPLLSRFLFRVPNKYSVDSAFSMENNFSPNRLEWLPCATDNTP